MDSLFESLGLLCLAIQEGGDNQVGRTKLQKMIYFADRYLGWDVGDYRLHYYGPYSQNVTESLLTATDELVYEEVPEFGPYQYELTDDGDAFLGHFVDTMCDEHKIELTREMFQELSRWEKDDLELAATLDFVSNNTPSITKEALIDKVSTIKENFSRGRIEKAYNLWLTWKTEHDI